MLEYIAIFLGHSPTSSYSCLCRSLSCNHVTITIIISSLRSLIHLIFTPFIHLSAPSIPAGYEPIVTTTITRFSKSKTQHLTSSTVANTLSGLPLKITPHQFSQANKLNHHKSFTEIASTKAWSPFLACTYLSSLILESSLGFNCLILDITNLKRIILAIIQPTTSSQYTRAQLSILL